MPGFVDLHATPHRPKPELSTTEPLLTSATASSALFHSFEPPRSTLGTATDLQFLDCEKLLRLQALMFNLIPDVALMMPIMLATPPTPPPTASTTNCWEHAACGASTGAVRLAAAAARRTTTPAILILFCLESHERATKLQCTNADRRVVSRKRKQKQEKGMDLAFFSSPIRRFATRAARNWGRWLPKQAGSCSAPGGSAPRLRHMQRLQRAEAPEPRFWHRSRVSCGWPGSRMVGGWRRVSASRSRGVCGPQLRDGATAM